MQSLIKAARFSTSAYAVCKKITGIFFLSLLFLQCTTPRYAQPGLPPRSASLENTIQHLKTADENYVLVVAHRGDWRNSPENSIEAIENAIAMGVDIVEIDVQKTKDGQLVLMHDNTIDRTTDGKGNVSDYTLAELKKFHLKNGLQRPTFHQIPTLEEAMRAAKGKILVNLDKCYGYFNQAYEVLEHTGTTGQAIMKGYVTSKTVTSGHGQLLDKMFFMPIINSGDKQAIQTLDEYRASNQKPIACEFSSVLKTDAPVLAEFKNTRRAGIRVWMNSLWASQCAGYEDDLAVKHADSTYGWFIKQGVNMIQTDRPELLLNWLRRNKLHD